jgi:S1-C subfamily serine protease
MVLASAGPDRVVVTGVVPGSPATTIGVGAGLQLVTINHRRVTSPADANAIISSLKLGSPVLLEFAEGGASVTAEIQEPGVP